MFDMFLQTELLFSACHERKNENVNVFLLHFALDDCLYELEKIAKLCRFSGRIIRSPL